MNLRKLSNTIVVITMALGLFGCGANSGPDTAQSVKRIAPPPESLENGSCQDACGDVSPDGCYCDPLCERIGDCCPDYAAACTVPCPAILCDEGTYPMDRDQDGCHESCGPRECPPIPCAPGQVAHDIDGDGCSDECGPNTCACKPLDCDEAIDTDGDGCEDECVAACHDQPHDPRKKYIIDSVEGCTTAKIACEPHQEFFTDECGCGCQDRQCPPVVACGYLEIPIDSDGDGCIDACEPVPVCQPFACRVGQPVDSDGDGCMDACEKPTCRPIVCKRGRAVDADGDGCPDRCVDNCPQLLCTPGHRPVDTDRDGCHDRCAPAFTCLAIPTCDPGDHTVDDPSDCVADGRCYERTICGQHIWCSSAP